MNTSRTSFRSSLLSSTLSLAAVGALALACGSDDADSGSGPGAYQGGGAPMSQVNSNVPADSTVPSTVPNGTNNSSPTNTATNNSTGLGINEQGQMVQDNVTPSNVDVNGAQQGNNNQGAGGGGPMPQGAGGGAMDPSNGAADASMQPDMQPDMQPADGLPTPPGQAFFFDDFESGASGTQPAAWQNWINYTTETNNTSDRPQFALLDNTESYTGSQSVHFHAEAATQPAMLTRALPAGTNSVYIRAYVKTSIQVGGVQPDAVSNHETMIGLRAEPGNGNDEIRFGGAKGALGFNMVGPGRSDAVAPLQAEWGSGPGMIPGQWHCVEIAYLNDGTPQAIAMLDGVVVRSVDNPGGWHIPVDNQWLNGLFNEVFIGWQSFSNQPANDVWMDDLVLSAQPVGCD